MKKLFFKELILLFLFLILTNSMSFSQTWNLPESKRNTRHTSDLKANIVRPALTIRGFDNGDLPTYHSDNAKIYGVKQILERAYGIGISFDESVRQALVRIIIESQEAFHTPSYPGNVEVNMSILKSKAAIALLTYVIELNDGDSGEPNIFTPSIKAEIPGMPSHSSIMAEIITYFESKPTFFFPYYPLGNIFKNAKAGMNLAQAWDFYLALENAYEEFESPTTISATLLSKADKEEWNGRLWVYVKEIYAGTREDLPLVGLGVGNHEVQAGNWPLIGFVSCGYIILGFNGTFIDVPDPETLLASHNDILMNAYLSSYTTKGAGPEHRRYYFNYQTGDGKRYWAEGAYYYSIVLEHLVPFYHALKANWFLPIVTTEGVISDPFIDNKFLNSVEWLADISTPEGKTPPIDDGRKEWIYPAQILNWSSAYGNSTTGLIGAKFQRIVDNPDLGYGKWNWLNVVELSMPRQQPNAATYTNKIVGNSNPNILTDQQIVLNYVDNDNDKHYLFFNGEHSDAITRGEGHEQPDQNQLIYYINDKSILIDPGYDSASGINNSSWNEYRHHNVMHHIYNNDGGLASPQLNAWLKRINSVHTQMDKLYYNNIANKITHIHGSLPIKAEVSTLKFATQYYERDLLFVRDKNYSFGSIPVQLVDFNSLTPILYTDDLFTWRMQYRFNGLMVVPYGGSSGWTTTIPYGSPRSSHIYFTAVDFHPNVSYNEWDTYTETVNESGHDLLSQNVFVRNAIPSMNFSTIAVITTGDDSPQDPVLLSATNPIPAKIAQIKHNSNVIDIVVKRSTSSTVLERNKAVEFKVADAMNYPLYLPGGKDFGFLRLINNSGVWTIDADFTVNIAHDYNNIYVTTTQNSPAYDTTRPVTVHNSAILTLTGSGTINRHFDMGAYSSLNVNGNYSFVGSAFRRKDPIFAWNTVRLNSDGVNMTNVTFTGAQVGLTVASRNNNVSKCWIYDNVFGVTMYNASSGRSQIHLDDCDIEDNHDYAIEVISGDLGLTNSRIERNAWHGIALLHGNIGTSSNIPFHDNLIEDNSEGLVVFFSGTANIDPNLYGGNNQFRLNGRDYGPAIKYELRVQAGGSLTIGDFYTASNKNYIDGHIPFYYDDMEWRYVSNENPTPLPARYTRWNYDPSSSSYTMFNGSVDYSNWSYKIANLSYHEFVDQKINESLSSLTDPSRSSDVRSEAIADIYRLMVTLDKNDPLWRSSIRLFEETNSDTDNLRKWELKNILELKLSIIKLHMHVEDYELARFHIDIMRDYMDEIISNEDVYGLFAGLLDAQDLFWAINTNNYYRAKELVDKVQMFIDERYKDNSGPNLANLNLHIEQMIAQGYVDTWVPDIKKPYHSQSGLANKNKEDATVGLISPYPNPFNPSTTIPFMVADAGNVIIDVYDTIGRRVKQLVNSHFESGLHATTFDATSLSSGLYIIRATINGNTYSQQVTLLK